MLRRIIILLIFFITTSRGEDRLIDKYINIALDNNLSLKQQEFSLQKSLAALNEARGLFMPSISINARYSRAGGGRIIEIPVGDFMNPLNKVINEIAGQPLLPENIPNEVIPFLREKEHETKVSLIQPLFKAAIYHNYKLNSNLSKIARMQRNLFKRQLVAEVKIAYFNYLKTINIYDILQKTQELLEENLRVSETLFQNQKATKDVVYRAKSDLSFLEQEKAEIQKNIDLARVYFNFLLNRALDEDIEISSQDTLQSYQNYQLVELESLALKNREEINQLKHAILAAHNHINISKSAYLPDLIAAVDYGFQGEEYRFTRDDDFWMASAVLQWNLFKGFQDKARVQQASLEKKRLETRNSELIKQIQLEVREAYHNVDVSKKSIQSAQDRLSSAEKSFEITNKKYQVGMISQVEYLDARNNWIEAKINYTITTFDYHIRQAELERVIGSYNVN